MGLLTALFLALPVLAWLEYRWIGEATRAEVDRTRNALRRAAEQFAAEFDSELARLHLAVVAGPEPDDRDRRYYAGRVDEWRSLTSRPELLQKLYVSEDGESGLDTLYELDERRNVRRVEWPANLAPLRPELAGRMAGPPGAGRRGPPGQDLDALILVAPRVTRRELPLLAQIRPEFGPEDGPPPRRDEPPPPRPRRPGTGGWVIAVLDRDFITGQWVPELSQKYFGGEGDRRYDVRIVARPGDKVIFGSSGADATRPDAEVPMFAVRPGPPRPQGGPPGGTPGRWLLQVRDHSGGIESVAAHTRARNLAVSAAVLLIMAASLVALWRGIRRSSQLAAQQMQFVASVSHELRTPLAVIRSAAENLADGVVTSSDSVKEYGSLIREEGRRLSYLVEQTLRFAGIQTGRVRYNLVPTNLAAVIGDALSSCEGTLRTAGCKVETDIATGLEPVLGDASALGVAIGNLLTNAARHAQSGGWVGVSAAPYEGKVRVQVKDRGKGIEPRDLPHLFEPFYRGQSATAAQVGGTGLGLALVKQIISAHNGEVAVESKPGQGACFTITLPAASGNA